MNQPKNLLPLLLVSVLAMGAPACTVMATGDNVTPGFAGPAASNSPSVPEAPGSQEFAPPAVDTASTCDSGQEIYLLGSDRSLHAFEPVSHALRDLPALRCPTTSTPYSMAVDSHGEAWVGFADGALFRATPSTGSCRATAFNGPKLGWGGFAMAFASTRDDGDSLYLLGNVASNFGQLATVDLSTEKLMRLGTVTPDGMGVDITGRGDGTLFGLVVGSPSYIARIDVAGPELVNRVDVSFNEVGAWAFAHWGGRFYMFTAAADSRSRLDVYTPGKGTKRVVDDLGFQVVGAGVSPCAPTELR